MPPRLSPRVSPRLPPRFWASLRSFGAGQNQSRHRVILGLILSLILGWLLLGWVFFPRNVTVARLLEQATAAGPNRSVKLKGRVVQRSPLLEGVVYQLEDRTGSIWVQSNPNNTAQIEVGQVLTVEGKPVYQAVIVEDLDFGALYIAERRRTARNRASKVDRNAR